MAFGNACPNSTSASPCVEPRWLQSWRAATADRRRPRRIIIAKPPEASHGNCCGASIMSDHLCCSSPHLGNRVNVAASRSKYPVPLGYPTSMIPAVTDRTRLPLSSSSTRVFVYVSDSHSSSPLLQARRRWRILGESKPGLSMALAS